MFFVKLSQYEYYKGRYSFSVLVINVLTKRKLRKVNDCTN